MPGDLKRSHRDADVSVVKHGRHQWGTAGATRDVILLLVLAVGAWLVARRFDVFERFVGFAADHEAWELDEWAVVSMILVLLLVAFSLRRWSDAVAEAAMHAKTVERLRIREHEIRAVVDAMPDLVFRLDRSGTCLAAKESSQVGLDAVDVVGRSVTDVLPPDAAQKVLEAIRRVEATGEAVEYSFEFPRWTGHELWEARFVPVAGSDDVLVVTRDFTSARRQERQLAASSERFRRAFEATAAGVAFIGVEDGRFLRVNPAGCEMLGYSESELIQMTISDVTHPDDRVASAERFSRVVSGEVPSMRSKLRYERRDGSTAYGLVTTSAVKGTSGLPLYAVAHVIDITQQERAERRLVELLASKDEFIASVSHELRTPLTAVVGYAELLKDETSLTPGEREQMISAIAEQSHDLSQMIEDLLIAAKIDTDSLTVADVPVDLVAQARHVLESLQHVDRVSRIVVTGGPAHARGDPARVRQIVRNLVTNALRYGGDTIEIRVAATERRGSIAVADDGVGVTADQMTHIFEPYHSAHTHEGMTASVGLGLTVSRKLARLMGGDVDYRRPAGETVFELTLPIDSVTSPGDATPERGDLALQRTSV